MRSLSFGWVLVAVACVQADSTLKTPSVVPLGEIWEAAYVRNEANVDVKIGYIHLSSIPIAFEDKKKGVRTTKELRFTINRSAASAEMKADVTTEEDGEGNVRDVKAKIWLGKDRVQMLHGLVIEGKQIRLTADGEFKYQREFRWDPTCVGLARELTLLRDKAAKAGDKFTYRYFEAQVANYVTVQVVVAPEEDVVLPGGLKRKLLKVVATPDPLKLPNGNELKMPPAIFFADATTYDIMLTQMNLPELGLVSLFRTSKVAALAPNGKVPDLMKRQSIFLKEPVRGMHDLNSIVYQVTVNGDATAKDLVTEDSRQTIKNAKPGSFELHITAKRKAGTGNAVPAAEEYTKSNYFINSDDAEVKKLAARAVGASTDPWEKAQKIEGFVRRFMKPVDYSEAMAPADHVAKTAAGDCTEYGMLTAAMCRAQGIPSRTALGLVYVDDLLGKPGLGFHMWTEVYIRGEWLGIDATLGKGSIGPGHIKITDHSWANIISFTPLLPVKGFIMANPTIEVLSK